jgi:catechol-2,3-dioxygenase
MLGQVDAAANIAVRDLNTARTFYKNTLGLTPVEEEEGEVIVFKSGNSLLNVYRSEYAGTNKATAVTWAVDDVRSEVDALRRKGISFEHYEMPGAKRDGDIHAFGDTQVAWFKDPEGNLLNLITRHQARR